LQVPQVINTGIVHSAIIEGMSPLDRIPRKNPVKYLPVTGRTRAWEKRIFFGILVAGVLAMLCGPVLAQPTPSPGAGAGSFGQGIMVYWPYHVLLMSAGFILLVTGFIIARHHKTGNWYNTHKLLEIAGGACIIAGLVVGISMVALSGLPHLRNIHEIFGVTTGLLVIVAIALGIFIRRAHTSKNAIRVSHRWLGWILTGLMVITIIFGLLFLSALLYR